MNEPKNRARELRAAAQEIYDNPKAGLGESAQALQWVWEATQEENRAGLPPQTTRQALPVARYEPIPCEPIELLVNEISVRVKGKSIKVKQMPNQMSFGF